MKKNLRSLLVMSVGSLLVAQGALAATGSNSVRGNLDADNSEKFMNVRLAPVALAVGGIGAHVDFGVADSITVGPTFSYQHAGVSFGDSETKVGIYELGARANLYLSGKRFTSGFLLGPYVSFMPASVSQKIGSKESSGSVSGISTGAVMSYQWVWNSGLNLNVGGGLGYYSLPSEAVVTAQADGTKDTVSVPGFTGVLPNIELTMGYVF